MGEREIFIDLRPDLRIRYRRNAPPAPIFYAVTIELLEDARWVTIRLWDNAHDPDEHHEHHYRRGEGKQPPIILGDGPVNAAMAVAIRRARRGAEAHVRQWQEES
jgi:hypothetical protein